MAKNPKAEMGKTEISIVEVTEELIRKKIYEIREARVMLDSDLAEIYGYETKDFNRQVKNNAKKFEGEEFMFRLTKTEFDNLRCKNSTSSWGGSRYAPYAFTEQGIYMLMTVLKGDIAIKQSRDLIRTFKKLKDYILDNQALIGQREVMQLLKPGVNYSIYLIPGGVHDMKAWQLDLYHALQVFFR